MKFELKRSEFEETPRALEITLAKMPEQAVSYRNKTLNWIAGARKKLDDCNPEEFAQKIRSVKSKRRTAQDE